MKIKKINSSNIDDIFFPDGPNGIFSHRVVSTSRPIDPDQFASS